MKTVVITGSTRGIGLGMAHEFLRRGHQVVICGRSAESLNKAVTELSQQYEATRVLGTTCDVSQVEQVQAVWDAAMARFSKVDIWINNAGISHSQLKTWEQPVETFRSVIDTNLLGAMIGSKVAMQGMLKQGFGQIYNMEGLGSDGRIAPGLIIYGTTKYGLDYFTKGLIKEAEKTPLQIGALSPGMVVTDMLVGDLEPGNERARRAFNILADRVETVTPFLVEKVLANTQNGARFAWLTTPKIAWRFLTARFNKRDVLSEPYK